MSILEEISQYLQRGDDAAVAELTGKAIQQKLPVQDVLNDGLVAGMHVISEQFRVHEIFLPDVLLAARAMNAGMDLVKPLLIGEKVPAIGRIIMGSVRGDLHDIGKNLVGIMLKGAGFEVIDLGNDVVPEAFIEAAEKNEAQLIGLSSLITTTMPVMKDVVALARRRCPNVQLIVGGAPVSKAFADEIGADDYAYDAANAVERCRALVGVS